MIPHLKIYSNKLLVLPQIYFEKKFDLPIEIKKIINYTKNRNEYTKHL